MEPKVVSSESRARVLTGIIDPRTNVQSMGSGLGNRFVRSVAGVRWLGLTCVSPLEINGRLHEPCRMSSLSVIARLSQSTTNSLR